MKLKQWALAAEIASGLAVLITLIFLVIGVRDNTRATQAAVYQELLQNINQFNLKLIDDAAMAQVWADRHTLDLDTMDKDDATRLIYMNRILFRVFDSAYFSFQNESLSSSQWLRFHESLCRQYPGQEVAPSWEKLWLATRQQVSAELASYFEEHCTD